MPYNYRLDIVQLNSLVKNVDYIALYPTLWKIRPYIIIQYLDSFSLIHSNSLQSLCQVVVLSVTIEGFTFCNAWSLYCSLVRA